jgi:hypothetical protein
MFRGTVNQDHHRSLIVLLRYGKEFKEIVLGDKVSC